MNMRIKSADRRYFIGGSDARIIMGDDEAPYSGSGGRSAARPSRRTFPATSSCSFGLVTEELNRRWYEAQYRPGDH